MPDLEAADSQVITPKSAPSPYYYMPTYTPEINQITRALFVNAGSATDRCAFDDILPVEEEDQQLDASEQNKYAPERGPAGERREKDGERILYIPLQGQRSFRILTVEPGKREDALRVTLSPTHLDDEHIDFEAISYSWGTPSDRGHLDCGGKLVSVPNNLLDALRQIRSPNQRKTVWADAICINQDDVEERSQQVAIMRHIFRHASRVLVWLGRDVEGIAKSAFELTCEIVKQWKPSGYRYSWVTYENLTEPISELPSSLSLIEDKAWEHLRRMFSLAWFRRVWVVQEANVARSVVVMWGEHHIAWPLVGLCAAWIVTRGWYALGDQSFAQAYNAFFQYAILPLSGKSTFTSFRELDLCIVLGAMREIFDATDARDHVYGILGLRLAGNDMQHDKLILQPNYGLSLKEVYIESAKTILAHDRHLRMLTAVQHGPEIDEQWPSWVPRWDKGYAVSLGFGDEAGFYANAGELFNTEYATEALFDPDGLALKVTGLRCQKIAQVSDELRWTNMDPESLGDLYPAMNLMIRELINPENKYRFRPSHDSEKLTLSGHTDEEVLEKDPLWYERTQTFSLTRSPGKYRQLSFSANRAADTLCGFALYWRERSNWRNIEGFDVLRRKLKGDGRPTDEIETILSAYNVLFRRRLFRCEDGSWGLGPAACRPGDSVVVLFGGTVPFVLRPRSEESNASSDDRELMSLSKASSYWTFVGECFKPDIMKGEAVKDRGLLGENHEVDENGLISFNHVSPDPRLSRKAGEDGVEQFVLR